jgi:protoheme IX farnesyltransferase
MAGSLPPVMGWTAATGSVGPEALILFGILFFWQFPHFFSLAWLYKDDYAQAGLHMLPVDPKSLGSAKEGRMAALSMLINSLLLLGVSLLPSLISLSGKFYFSMALGLGLWITLASLFFLFERSRQRARQVFFASILYVPLLFVSMVVNK